VTLKDFLSRLDVISVLGFLIAIETQITNGSMSFAHTLPEAWIPIVKEWAANLASAGGLLVGVIRMTGNSTSAASVVAKVLLAAFVLSLFLAVGSAQAAPVPKSRPAAAPVDLLTKMADDIAKLKATVVAGVIGGLNEADADAANLTNPNDPTSFHDPISHACYPAQIKFLQSLPSAAAIKTPAPYNVFPLFQRKRDFVLQLQAGIPTYLKMGCAPMLGDEKTIFIKTLAMLGVTVGAGVLTGIFPAAAPLTLPALSLPL
jgi:hypothetical protein